MEQSAGAKRTARIIEAYNTAKSSSVGSYGDWQKFNDLVAQAQVDPEMKDDIMGNLNAQGLSITKAKAAVTTAKRLMAAVAAEFPNAIPETE